MSDNSNEQVIKKMNSLERRIVNLEDIIKKLLENKISENSKPMSNELVSYDKKYIDTSLKKIDNRINSIIENFITVNDNDVVSNFRFAMLSDEINK
jgi:hypothetical protein